MTNKQNLPEREQNKYKDMNNDEMLPSGKVAAVDRPEAIARLLNVIKRDFGSQKAYAEHHGCTSSYVNQIIKGSAPIPIWVLNKIGLRASKATVYEDINHQNTTTNKSGGDSDKCSTCGRVGDTACRTIGCPDEPYNPFDNSLEREFKKATAEAIKKFEEVFTAELQAKQDSTVDDESAAHLSHCNQDEFVGGCKYGEADTCPALNQDNSAEALADYILEECIVWSQKHQEYGIKVNKAVKAITQHMASAVSEATAEKDARIKELVSELTNLAGGGKAVRLLYGYKCLGDLQEYNFEWFEALDCLADKAKQTLAETGGDDNELKPCPFCGGSHILFTAVFPERSTNCGYVGICSNCGTKAPIGGATKDEAAYRWNIRPIEASLTKQLEDKDARIKELLAICDEGLYYGLIGYVICEEQCFIKDIANQFKITEEQALKGIYQLVGEFVTHPDENGLVKLIVDVVTNELKERT